MVYSYALLFNKQQATYRCMFMMVKEAALNSWPLRQFFQTLSRHWYIQFPYSTTCYYHYSQAIWRKVKALGLQEEHKADDEILKSFVQKTAAIYFIHPAYVRVVWQGLQHEAPDIDRIDNFVEYFDHTWINRQYRIRQWNNYDYVPWPKGQQSCGRLAFTTEENSRKVASQYFWDHRCDA